MKTCKRCEIEKSVTEFRSHKKTKDRLHSYCRDCTRILSQIARDQRTPEQIARIKASVKRKNNTDEAKSKRAAYAKLDSSKENRKERNQSPERKRVIKRWRDSEKGKASRKAYDTSDKGKSALERMRLKVQTVEGKAAKAKASARYDKSDKGKAASERKRAKSALQIKARATVNNAARYGGIPHISTQVCSECGKQAIQYHHHNGYEYKHWLDVIPLCIACHNKLDNP